MRFLITIFAVGIYITTTFIFPSYLDAKTDTGKKAIILILDSVSLEEIIAASTPNMDKLLANGGVAHMNTRAKSSVANRGSTYLSLGMGVRTLASTQGTAAYDYDEKVFLWEDRDLIEGVPVGEIYKVLTGMRTPNTEVINIAIGDIKRTAFSITPNNEVGILGKTAREEGLVFGIIGNSDNSKLGREATLLAIDEKGGIPYGSVSSALLEEDPTVLGGKKLNEKSLTEEAQRILPKVDVLFIDYGDPSRVEENNRLAMDNIQVLQKQKAIERADSFLGIIMSMVNLEKSMFMVIGPNPSKEMIREGNFGLTPVIFRSPVTQQGLLTSNTTRKEGLVTNFDFAPTILGFFNVDKPVGYVGEPMQVVASAQSLDKLLEDQQIYLSLRKFRYIFHWVYITITGLALGTLFLPYFSRWKGLRDNRQNVLGLTVLALPLTLLTVSRFGYFSIFFDVLFVITGAFLIAYFVNRVLSENILKFFVLGISTSLLLLFDVFTGGQLMITSPLGSDAIAGGRFYGIGNDLMGVLLGSTLLTIFSLHQYFNIQRGILAAIISVYLVAVIIALSPIFGANVGGTLSALVILSLLLLKTFGKSISIKRLIIVIATVIIVIIGLAIADANFNPNPTHAGKAIQSISSGGPGKLLEMIGIKLGQVLWNLVNAIWNYVLFIQVIILVLLNKHGKELIKNISASLSRLYMGLSVTLLGAAVVFAFNDTGTIAAALMLIYFFIPLGLALKR